MIGDELRGCCTKATCSCAGRSRISTRAQTRWCKPSCSRRVEVRWRAQPAWPASASSSSAACALFTVGLFMIGDRQMAFAKKFTIYTEFKKITGLQPGGIIRVSGARAGAIKKIVPPNAPGGKFQVELEIIEELHPLVRMDSLASIETEGLVGGSYLGVGSGTGGLSFRRVRRDDSEPGAVRDRRADAADGDTVKKVNTTIDEMKGDLQRAVASAADTVDVANKLLADVSGDVKQMASNGARLSADSAQIAETIRKGEGTLGKLVNDDELYRRATNVAKQAERLPPTRARSSSRRRTRWPDFSRKTVRSKAWRRA